MLRYMKVLTVARKRTGTAEDRTRSTSGLEAGFAFMLEPQYREYVFQTDKSIGQKSISRGASHSRMSLILNWAVNCALSIRTLVLLQLFVALVTLLALQGRVL